MFGHGDYRPVGVPVDQHKIRHASMVEVVGAYVLEGVLRVGWCGRGHCSLGGCIPVAGGALGSGERDVIGHAGPEDGCFGPGSHAAGALMGGVEGVEAGLAEGSGDHYPLASANDAVYCGEGVQVGVVFADGRRQVVFGFGRAVFDHVGQLLECGVGCCGDLEILPCDRGIADCCCEGGG